MYIWFETIYKTIPPLETTDKNNNTTAILDIYPSINIETFNLHQLIYNTYTFTYTFLYCGVSFLVIVFSTSWKSACGIDEYICMPTHSPNIGVLLFGTFPITHHAHNTNIYDVAYVTVVFSHNVFRSRTMYVGYVLRRTPTNQLSDSKYTHTHLILPMASNYAVLFKYKLVLCSKKHYKLSKFTTDVFPINGLLIKETTQTFENSERSYMTLTPRYLIRRNRFVLERPLFFQKQEIPIVAHSF